MNKYMPYLALRNNDWLINKQPDLVLIEAADPWYNNFTENNQSIETTTETTKSKKSTKSNNSSKSRKSNKSSKSSKSTISTKSNH